MRGMRRIGIIASFEEEAGVVLSALKDTRSQDYAGISFTLGTLAGKEIVLMVCGLGKVNAARSAQAMIDRFAPDAVIHTGVAGSLCEEAAHLGLVVSKDLTYHDAEDMLWMRSMPPYTDLLPTDDRLREALAKAAEPAGGAITGRMATGDVFVRAKALKDDIRSRLNAVCVDMEVCATAHVACLNGVPYCAIKCISDMADDDAGETFEDFVKTAADKAAGTALRAIALL